MLKSDYSRASISECVLAPGNEVIACFCLKRLLVFH